MDVYRIAVIGIAIAIVSLLVGEVVINWIDRGSTRTRDWIADKWQNMTATK